MVARGSSLLAKIVQLAAVSNSKLGGSHLAGVLSLFLSICLSDHSTTGLPGPAIGSFVASVSRRWAALRMPADLVVAS